jgi:hypothetical protein
LKPHYLLSIGPKSARFLAFLLLGALYVQNAMPSAVAADSFLYLKVQVEPKVKAGSLKPGDVVEGSLIRDVYWHDRKVIPAGSHLRLVVDRLEQRKRIPNDHWPWAIEIFAPRHEKYPIFRSAHVVRPDGRTMDLQVSLLSFSREVMVRAEPRKKKLRPDSPDGLTVTSASERRIRGSKALAPGLTANLQAFADAADLPADPGSPTSITPAETMTIPAGAEAKVVLLDSVSASASHAGDTFQARLIEPVTVSSTVALPAGSILEGRVAKAQKPRMMSRSGSLLLSFTSVIGPDGTAKRIDGSMAGVRVDKGSHARVGTEGEIQGGRPGIGWAFINMGVTGGLSKAADDGTQLILEAVISTATDASTAGTSRVVAACVSGVFMLTRHGRDVVLPKFAEMDIAFNRPLVLSGATLDAIARGNNREPAQPKVEE